MKPSLPPEEIIEVVMRKQMTLVKYYAMLEKAKKQGWQIKAYQTDFYNGDNIKIEITK